jgi:hypothetical protein
MITFDIQGSAAQPYHTTFIKDGEKITATCTCPAGQFGRLCKHRTGLLAGDASAVVSDNADQVNTVTEWIIGTETASNIAKLREAEKVMSKAKRELTKAKKALVASLEP